MKKSSIKEIIREKLGDKKQLTYALATNLAKYGKPQTPSNAKHSNLTKKLDKKRETYVKDLKGKIKEKLDNNTEVIEVPNDPDFNKPLPGYKKAKKEDLEIGTIVYLPSYGRDEDGNIDYNKHYYQVDEIENIEEYGTKFGKRKKYIMKKQKAFGGLTASDLHVKI